MPAFALTFSSPNSRFSAPLPNQRPSAMKLPQLVLCVIACFCPFAAARAQVIDNQQLIDTATISARMLPGYSIVQSFTPGRTGTLTGVSMGFYNAINGAATLNIYAGNTATGSPIATFSVTVISILSVDPTTSRRTLNMNHWNGLTAPVTAGQRYCFELVPGAGMTDPYAVAAATVAFTGGNGQVRDPTGSYVTFPLVFQTRIL